MFMVRGPGLILVESVQQTLNGVKREPLRMDSTDWVALLVAVLAAMAACRGVSQGAMRMANQDSHQPTVTDAAPLGFQSREAASIVYRRSAWPTGPADAEQVGAVMREPARF
jgi:hypothetical protein